MSSSADGRIRELLAVPPGEFVAARTAAVKDLKAQGDAAAAAEMAGLRKPPLRVWAANRAAAGRADATRRLADAAERLREVERRVAGGEKGLGPELREAAAEQRLQLEVLESEARRLLEDVGAAVSAAAEARELLRAAVREGGAAWQRLAGGTLLEEPAAEEESVFALAAADLPARTSAGAEEEAGRRRRLQAEAAARQARDEAIALDRAARELEEQARAARRRADAAAQRADAADAALRPG